MLDEQQIYSLTSDMWLLRQRERMVLDDIYDYMLGRKGFPRVPDNCETEIEELARLSMKNVLPTTLPPASLIRCSAAAAVPPVASRSSARRTVSPGVIASRCISTEFVPYSSE